MSTSLLKQCVPDALAGAPGTSPEDEGADRPTPHARTVADSAACRNRKVILVWRDGMLSVTERDRDLTVLQHALLYRTTHPPA